MIIWLRHEQALLSKTRKQLRLPKARMKVRGLAVARPVSVGPREREIELIQGPRRRNVGRPHQHLEDIAWRPISQIIERRSRSDAWRHGFTRRAALKARSHCRLRFCAGPKAILMRGHHPHPVHSPPHHDEPEIVGLGLLYHNTGCQRVIADPGADRRSISEAVPPGKRQRINVKFPLGKLAHSRSFNPPFLNVPQLGPKHRPRPSRVLALHQPCPSRSGAIYREAILYVSRVIIKNYRCLREADVTLNPDLNIIVGNNECGKSTLLEAIHLALSGQLNGRPIHTELHPHLFNAQTVADYIAALAAKKNSAPPAILIELHFPDDPALARLKGINNSLGLDVPGVSLSIEFNREYADEFKAYVADPSVIRSLPIEYYVVRWRGFDDNEITSRSIPIKPAFIDASTIRNNAAANRYVVDIMRDSLTRGQKVDLALSYRLMKDAFLDDTKVKGVNAALASKKGDISEKTLSVSLDTSSRSTWEAGIMPHLDDVPLTLVGKGEQNSIKIKLAMELNADLHLILSLRRPRTIFRSPTSIRSSAISQNAEEAASLSSPPTAVSC